MRLHPDTSPITKPVRTLIDFMRLSLVDFEVSKTDLATRWFESHVAQVMHASVEVNESMLKISRALLLMMIFKACIAGLNKKHPMGPACFCGVGLDHSQNRKNIAPP